MTCLGFKEECKKMCFDSKLTQKRIINIQEQCIKATYKQYHKKNQPNNQDKIKISLKNFKTNTNKKIEENQRKKKIIDCFTQKQLQIIFSLLNVKGNKGSNFQSLISQFIIQKQRYNQIFKKRLNQIKYLKTQESLSNQDQQSNMNIHHTYITSLNLSKTLTQQSQQIQVPDKLTLKNQSYAKFIVSLFQLPQTKTQYNTQRQSNQYESSTLQKNVTFQQNPSLKKIENNYKRDIKSARLTVSKHFGKSSFNFTQ